MSNEEVKTGYTGPLCTNEDGIVAGSDGQALVLDGVTGRCGAQNAEAEANTARMVHRRNTHDEMLAELETVLGNLQKIAALLNGGPSPDDIRDAYRLAYWGDVRKVIAKARGEVAS